MSVALRRATIADAPLLAEHRGAVWVEVGDWSAEDIAAQVPVWTDFFRHTLAEGTYLAYVAEENGAQIASGAILVHLTIPRPKFDSQRAGRVQSVYVVPAARRRGVGRAVMDALLETARAERLVYLALHPSDEARGLYAAMGFTQADEMGLRLAAE